MVKKAPKFPEDQEDSHAEDTLRAIKEEEPVFKKVRYKGQKIWCFLNTGCLLKMFSSSGVGMQTKGAIKRFLTQMH